MRKLLSRMMVGLAVLGVAGVLTACDPPEPNCSQVIAQFADVPVVNITNVADAERAVYCLTNQRRAAEGVSPAYKRRAKLDTAARGHANAANNQNWWDDPPPNNNPHVNPNGNTTPTTRARAAGYCPSGTALVHENVFWGWGTGSFAPTPRDAVDWWMGSPGHYANITNSGLRDIGLGVAKGSPEDTNWANAAIFVQKFAVCT